METSPDITDKSARLALLRRGMWVDDLVVALEFVSETFNGILLDAPVEDEFGVFDLLLIPPGILNLPS